MRKYNNLGFTGTRKGITKAQFDQLSFLLGYLRPLYARHGGAIGADAEFHEMCLMQRISIDIFPSTMASQVADLHGYNKIYRPAPPLSRNKVIVQYSDYMIAVSGTAHEVQRSGTWATIRYTKRMQQPIITIFPSGHCHYSHCKLIDLNQ